MTPPVRMLAWAPAGSCRVKCVDMIYAGHVQTKALFSGLYKSVLCKLGYNYQVYYRSMSQGLTNSGAHTTGKTLLQDQGLITNTFEQLCP